MRIAFKYRLNKNWKDSDELMLEHQKVLRSWTTFNRKVDVFDKYVKTKDNPKGILDMVEYDIHTQEVFIDSEKNFTKKVDKFYDRLELATFDRQTLEKIARDLDISPVKKRDEFLVDLIVKEQDKVKEKKEAEEAESKKKEEEAIKKAKAKEERAKKLAKEQAEKDAKAKEEKKEPVKTILGEHFDKEEIEKVIEKKDKKKE